MVLEWQESLELHGNNNLGITGVCWDISLLPVVVAGADSKITTDRVIEAINYAAAQGVHVINMSLAISAKSVLLENACKAAQEYAVLVASAGNQGQN